MPVSISLYVAALAMLVIVKPIFGIGLITYFFKNPKAGVVALAANLLWLLAVIAQTGQLGRLCKAPVDRDKVSRYLLSR
jgi:hypothetical protein